MTEDEFKKELSTLVETYSVLYEEKFTKPESSFDPDEYKDLLKFLRTARKDVFDLIHDRVRENIGIAAV